MKVYDPRLDTSPGANPTNPAYHVETKNPALWVAALASGNEIDWPEVVRGANYCDELVPAPMTEQRAREILGKAVCSQDELVVDNGKGMATLMWYPDDDKAGCFNTFTADELEAIAWWMRNKARA
jgi:hypothetical protein